MTFHLNINIILLLIRIGIKLVYKFNTLLDSSDEYVLTVFCTQNHGYLQLGDIIWFAETAAMAWELPDDPSLFNMLKSELRDPTAARREDNKHIYYLDEVGKVIAKVPYKR